MSTKNQNDISTPVYVKDMEKVRKMVRSMMIQSQNTDGMSVNAIIASDSLPELSISVSSEIFKSSRKYTFVFQTMDDDFQHGNTYDNVMFYGMITDLLFPE